MKPNTPPPDWIIAAVDRLQAEDPTLTVPQARAQALDEWYTIDSADAAPVVLPRRAGRPKDSGRYTEDQWRAAFHAAPLAPNAEIARQAGCSREYVRRMRNRVAGESRTNNTGRIRKD